MTPHTYVELDSPAYVDAIDAIVRVIPALRQWWRMSLGSSGCAEWRGVPVSPAMTTEGDEYIAFAARQLARAHN
jgi:hypothetical protein